MRLLVVSSILFAVLLQSCSCNWHLKKARGKCGYTSDTVYKNIEVLVPKVETDTVFKHSFTSRDTVIIREGRLTMRYFYNTHDSTVFLSGKCDTVTITKKVPVIVNKYRMTLPLWAKVVIWLLGILIVAVLAAIVYHRLIFST